MDATSLTIEPTGDNSATSSDLYLEPMFKIWLDGPVAWEEQALRGNCLAYGLYTGHNFPDGLPMFIFDGNEGQFIVHAPLVTDYQIAYSWVKHSRSNGVRFYLMERQTGIIKAMRIVPLVKSFMLAVGKTWTASPAQHPIDLQRYSNLLSKNDNGKLWAASRKWIYNFDTEDFEET